MMNLTDAQNRCQDIERELQLPETFNNPQKLKLLNIEYAELKEKIDLLLQLQKLQDDLRQAEETLNSTQDETLKTLAEEDAEYVKSQMSNVKCRLDELEPNNPLDKRDIIVEIRAAAGGDEAGLFAASLFRMYARYAEEKGWKTAILSSNRTGVGGFKEVIFEIKGQNVYSDLKYESGVHRVQRIPETEKSGRIHTSTATVAVLPEAKDIEVALKPEELRIDVFRAGGHGGQSVNTTDSAVRITHLPSGLVASCQDERSQQQNKERALTILKSRLLSLETEKQKNALDSARRGQIGRGERSEKIRTYNFPQDRITDHRIKKSWGQIERILDGELRTVIATLKKSGE